MRLRNRVVVITGASGGIGRATALACAVEGANVVLVARREPALEETARQCRERGATALVVTADLVDYEAAQEIGARAVERFGRVDAWVNNAAVSAFGTFTELPLGDVRRVLDVNLMGYVHGAQVALPLLRRQGRGVLVNVSSVAGVVAQPYTHAYSMSKSAIRTLGMSLRQELYLYGARGVHVCTVLPASVDTPIFEHAANVTGRAVNPSRRSTARAGGPRDRARAAGAAP